MCALNIRVKRMQQGSEGRRPAALLLLDLELLHVAEFLQQRLNPALVAARVRHAKAKRTWDEGNTVTVPTLS